LLAEPDDAEPWGGAEGWLAACAGDRPRKSAASKAAKIASCVAIFRAVCMPVIIIPITVACVSIAFPDLRID